MPTASKQTAAETVNLLGIERRYAVLGDHTVSFETFSRDVDMAPLFRGLPGDSCQSPHWGVLLSGKVVFRYGDEVEVVNAGDAYYARPGHTALVAAGTELVEFSPSAPAQQAEGVSVRNMVAALSDPDSIAATSLEAGTRAA